VKNENRVDPELLPALELYPPMELNLENLVATREMGAQMTLDMNAQLPEVEGVSLEDRQAPGPEGDPDVRIRICKPMEQTGPLPGFLWIHGGGYVLGGIDGDDYGNKLRVNKVGCVIVSVDYRLAPEHPYPAPVEDCYTALKWMFNHADDIGVDRSRIAIGGASAGGGLTAGLALLARDRSETDVVFQMLMYPMIDDRNIAPASEKLPDKLIWSRAKNLFGWTSYLGREPGGDDVPYTAAASRAVDVSGLPPALIVVGDLDLFVDENIEYARQLIQAGIPSEMHVYPGAYHGFNGFVPGATISRKCNATCDQALKKALYK
jgi:acetyl esterase/lipase